MHENRPRLQKRGHSQPLDQRRASTLPTRGSRPDMATALIAQPQHTRQQNIYGQSPPRQYSPPTDELRKQYNLPSISSLMNMPEDSSACAERQGRPPAAAGHHKAWTDHILSSQRRRPIDSAVIRTNPASRITTPTTAKGQR